VRSRLSRARSKLCQTLGAADPSARHVWATGDDSKQATDVNGTVQVCSRSAACANSTQWLMPAGPSFTLVYPVYLRRRFLIGPHPIKKPHPIKNLPPRLPVLPALLPKLNSYSTGCTDVAGDCNAVAVIANMLTGYGNQPPTPADWFLALADVPGATVQNVTDVTGQHDVAFVFPFTSGVNEILLNAHTYQYAGYRSGTTETVITNQAEVSGPGVQP
jgi:hypothetical protein